MLCRRMRLTERHLQPSREPLEGPIVRPCTARKLMNLDAGPSGIPITPAPSPHNAISHATITIPTGDALETGGEPQSPVSPRGRKPNECPPKTPLMIVNLNIPPGTETLAPKSAASRTERHKLPPFCVQYRNLPRFCSAPAGSCAGGPGPASGATGPPGAPHLGLGPGPGAVGAAMIPQIFIQSFELQDRRAAEGAVAAADETGGRSSQQYHNIITENDEDTFATLLLDNISNISLEMIQRHQQKLLGTAGSSLTEASPLLTAASGTSGATGFQHAEGCSSMERTESKTSADGALPMDLRMDSSEERFETIGRSEFSAGQRRMAATVAATAAATTVTQDASDELLTDIPPGYRSLCYRTPSPKTRQIIRVDIVTSREKY